jgi:hypothetical protein
MRITGMIDRFHPPFWPGTRDHMPMDRMASGTFVLYRDHDQLVKWRDNENQALRAQNKGLKKEITELRKKIKELEFMIDGLRIPR